MSILIAALTMLSTPPAAEPEWYRVNAGKQTAAYVPRNNISVDGDLRTANTITMRAAPMLDSGALAFMTKQTFNCATGEVSDLKITYLNSTGDVINSVVPPAGFHSIVEGTNVDFARRFVCTGEGGTRVDDIRTDSDAFFGK